MDKIAKYKKTIKVLRVASIAVGVPLLAYLIITVLLNDLFEKDDIVACSLFALYFVVVIFSFIFLDNKRNKLLKARYGNPTQLSKGQKVNKELAVVFDEVKKEIDEYKEAETNSDIEFKKLIEEALLLLDNNRCDI